MFGYIDPFYFFVALFIGMFITYISTPTPDVIIKYPTPENVGKIIYKDNADVCYKYEMQEVDCPIDKSKIKKIKLQYVDNEGKNKQGLLDRIISKFQ